MPSGVIVVDKPANITSARVVAVVKRLLGAKKVGHTGTLDPFATGVMICCVNNATKLARFFLHGDKKYEAVIHLGIETDTQDSTGTVIFTSDRLKLPSRMIRSAFERFKGETEQSPPIYSALKHKGVPLYRLARNGKPVKKPARRIFISHLEILKIDLPFIHFTVCCSAGTYIRTLCADIGKMLGCGGHLEELRRIECSGFTIKDAVTLSELKKLALPGKLSDRIIGMASALSGMPECVADKALAEKIMYGKIITEVDFAPGQIDSHKDHVKIVDVDNDLLAVLNIERRSRKYDYCSVFHK